VDTCRAAVFSGDGTFDVREFPMPSAPPGGAVLKVEAVGLCASDVAQLHGHKHVPGEVSPLVPGHEIVGRIHSLAPDAALGVTVGMRVGVDLIRRCGACEVCASGSPYCPQMQLYGYTQGLDVGTGLHGGYGEYMEIMPNTNLVPLTEDVPASQLSLFEALPRAPVPGPQARPGTHAPALPSVFRHPRAQRELLLGEHRVAYELRRARRRSIGFLVDVEGLSVAAPRWVGLGEIEAALREKAAWILRKLAEQHERGERLRGAKVDWRDGATFPFLGATVIVVLDPRAGATPSGALLDADSDALPGVPRPTLHLALPHHAAPEQIRDAVQSWLQRQARRIFEERCAHFAERLGVCVRRISLSSARTRWGSASADGSVRLNWRLVHYGMSTIDYVVAHELAHLRHMDHSPKFWDVVRSVVPDVERARSVLKSELVPVFD